MLLEDLPKIVESLMMIRMTKKKMKSLRIN